MLTWAKSSGDFFLIIKSVDEVAVTTLDILYFYHFFRTTEPISIKNSMRNPSVKVFTIYFFQIKESKGANVHILKLLKTSWNILQKLWRIFFRAKYQVILKPISWTSLTMDDWSLLSYEFLGVGRGIQWGVKVNTCIRNDY